MKIKKIREVEIQYYTKNSEQYTKLFEMIESLKKENLELKNEISKLKWLKH